MDYGLLIHCKQFSKKWTNPKPVGISQYTPIIMVNFHSNSGFDPKPAEVNENVTAEVMQGPNQAVLKSNIVPLLTTLLLILLLILTAPSVCLFLNGRYSTACLKYIQPVTKKNMMLSGEETQKMLCAHR